jgi:triacylglycerol lipase
MTLAPKELVILVHGLGRSRLSMWKLERALEAQGYQVINWGYNSLTGGIIEHGNKLADMIASLPKDLLIHGVGHSLGGLILRQAFVLQPQAKRRLVTLGTPHHGARLIARYPLLFNQHYIPQVIREMHPESLTMRDLPIPNIEIGVIAGIQKFHLFNPISWLNCLANEGIPHDGTVDVESTKAVGLTDYREIYVNHSFIPSNNAAINYVSCFLQHGKFDH